jgi:NTE family protein
MRTSHSCDLVLEGGGVKGLGLVGAVTTLQAHGYAFRRVAGTSAGAVVGSLVASGMEPAVMLETMQGLDYTKFQDKNVLDHFGLPGEVISLLINQGIFKGEFLHHWLSAELEKLGVTTFKDLRLKEDWAENLPAHERYKLVVIASDVSRGEMVRLPWDYHRYGLDPDKQLVADAVRASMSIPFFYVPKKLGRSRLVDGGLLSDFPVSIFDSPAESRWPTFGVKLSAKPRFNKTIHPVHSTWALATSLFSTMQQAHDMMHLEDPSVIRRTMFVDSGTIKPTDFGITRAEQHQLYESGQRAATKFLASWSFADFKNASAKHPSAGDL